MGVHRSIGVRLGRARQGRRRAYALVGTFAILFQAVLFAWHHHPASFHVRSAGPAATLAAPTSPVMPALADHDCEICFALSHHGAEAWTPAGDVMRSFLVALSSEFSIHNE